MARMVTVFRHAWIYGVHPHGLIFLTKIHKSNRGTLSEMAARTRMAAQDFFNRVYRDARNVGGTHILSAIAAAQSSIETGWGKHVKGNAYFGIKASRSWKGKTVSFTTHEVRRGKRVKIKAKFRAYDDFADSVRDHLKTIKSKWPDTHNAPTLAGAARGLANGVHGAYATAPKYCDKVRRTAQSRANAARMAYEGKVAKQLPKRRSRPKQSAANPKSNILPFYRPKQSDSVTLAVLAKFANLMPATRRGDAVKVLVVRGYYLNSMGKSGKNDRALYDDAIFVVSPDGIQPFNGNSDPSVFRKRVATIKANQAIRYKPGMHGYKRKSGPYRAFRQNAPCTVVRDGVGDDTGMFAVNFHRGGVRGTSSLGCLTVPPHQWNEFYGLVSGLLKKHGQGTFYVTLLEYAGGNPPIPKAPPSLGPDAMPAGKPKTKSKPKLSWVAAAIAAGGLGLATFWQGLKADFFSLLTMIGF